MYRLRVWRSKKSGQKHTHTHTITYLESPYHIRQADVKIIAFRNELCQFSLVVLTSEAQVMALFHERPVDGQQLYFR